MPTWQIPTQRNLTKHRNRTIKSPQASYPILAPPAKNPRLIQTKPLHKEVDNCKKSTAANICPPAMVSLLRCSTESPEMPGRPTKLPSKGVNSTSSITYRNPNPKLKGMCSEKIGVHLEKNLSLNLELNLNLTGMPNGRANVLIWADGQPAMEIQNLSRQSLAGIEAMNCKLKPRQYCLCYTNTACFIPIHILQAP